MKRPVGSRALPPRTYSVAVRTESGRVVGYLDPTTLQMQVRRGRDAEIVHLRQLLGGQTAVDMGRADVLD